MIVRRGTTQRSYAVFQDACENPQSFKAGMKAGYIIKLLPCWARMPRALGRGVLDFLAAFLIMAVASLFIASFMNVALAEGGMQVDKVILKGEVVGIGNAHNVKTLLLRPERVWEFPSGTMKVYMNKDTKLQVCNESKPLMWTEGRNATVIYHEVEGVAVADSISEQC